MDEMDFVTYTQQRWEDIPHSHADPVKVTWPDGRVTTSLAVHIEDMKKMFEIAPNTSIQEHPVMTANDDWTAMTGILKGTVTFTGKSFEITMVTVAKWDGLKIVEELLFWDNANLSKQMGFEQSSVPTGPRDRLWPNADMSVTDPKRTPWNWL